MTISTKFPKRGTAFFVLAVVLLIYSVTSSTAGYVLPEPQEAMKLKLVVGKSAVLRSSEPVKRASVANPEIADFILLSRQEIYLTGKASGITTLTVWQDSKVAAIYDLEVTYDITRLKENLQDLLPGERDLRVIATNDSITLSGLISSTANLSLALNLAEQFAPKNKVVNLVQVAGVHQVMLEVRVAEMSRNLMNRLGINLAYHDGTDFGLSLLGGLTQVVRPEEAHLLAGPVGLLASPAVNALFRFHKGSTNWTGFIDALKSDGLIKVLAEPTLIALSGQTADFLVGGEFPVPVPQGLGTAAIEYKGYGVSLSFSPTVLSENKISIKVQPEVSDLDYSTALQFQGFLVPGIITRRASTLVELADGQSFAIAGLLKETVRNEISKYPLLGDIPILGVLFQSKSFQRNETELIIIVTPHLVKPLNMAEQTLPTDFYLEPSDTEFYLRGLLEGRDQKQPKNIQGELDGDFGHAVPISK